MVTFDEDDEKPGVIACCNKKGTVADAFPSEVMQV